MKDPELQKLFLVVSILDTLGYSLPVQFSTVAGISPSELKERISRNDSANSVLGIRESGIYSHHRQFGLRSAQAQVTRDEAAVILRELAIQLHPYVNDRTIRERTLPYRILAGVMRAKALRGWIGPDNLQRWYGDLAGLYRYNARFCEQRAIAAQLNMDWGPAESFARQATDLAPRDAYRFNTLRAVS